MEGEERDRDNQKQKSQEKPRQAAKENARKKFEGVYESKSFCFASSSSFFLTSTYDDVVVAATTVAGAVGVMGDVGDGGADTGRGDAYDVADDVNTATLFLLNLVPKSLILATHFALDFPVSFSPNNFIPEVDFGLFSAPSE